MQQPPLWPDDSFLLGIIKWILNIKLNIKTFLSLPLLDKSISLEKGGSYKNVTICYDFHCSPNGSRLELLAALEESINSKRVYIFG